MRRRERNRRILIVHRYSQLGDTFPGVHIAQGRSGRRSHLWFGIL